MNYFLLVNDVLLLFIVEFTVILEEDVQILEALIKYVKFIDQFSFLLDDFLFFVYPGVGVLAFFATSPCLEESVEVIKGLEEG